MALPSIRSVYAEGPDAPPASPPVRFARRVWTVVAIVASAALIGLGVWEGRTALLLIYVSLLAATGLLPVVQRLEQWTTGEGGRTTVPRWLTIGVVYMLIVTLFIALCRLIIPPIVSQMVALRDTLPSLFGTWQGWLVRHDWITRRVSFADVMHQSAPTVDVNQPIALAASAARQLASVLFETMTVIILTFYMLLDGPHVTTELARAVPPRHRAHFTAVVRDVTRRVSAWLQGNLMLAAIMGGVTAASMAILGEPFFYVVAVVAAAGEFVPIAGPILAGSFAVLLALTVSVKLALWVGVVFLALHQLETNVLMPHIMGHQVGLSTLAVFVAVLLGAEWFGLVGAILAIPTTAIVSAVVVELRTPRPEHAATA